MKNSLGLLDRHHGLLGPTEESPVKHLNQTGVWVPHPRLLFPKVQDGDGAWDAGDCDGKPGERASIPTPKSSTASHFLLCRV